MAKQTRSIGRGPILRRKIVEFSGHEQEKEERSKLIKLCELLNAILPICTLLLTHNRNKVC